MKKSGFDRHNKDGSLGLPSIIKQPHIHLPARSSATVAGDRQEARRTAVPMKKSCLDRYKDSSLSLSSIIKQRNFSNGTPYHILRDHLHIPQPTIGIVDDFAYPPLELSITKEEVMILTKGKESFIVAIEKDKRICTEHMKNDNLRSLFATLEPAVRVRGMLSPYSLHDKQIRSLCDGYLGALGKGRPLYLLTAYDFTNNYVGMPKSFRRPFLDFLCDAKTIITPDWEAMGTSITQNLYDNGLRLPRHKRESNNTSRYKGESDASFRTIKVKDEKGNEHSIIKANIAIIIWKDDKIIWSEMIEEIDCETSVEAEALAMALLLKRAIQMDIDYFEVCTDCDIIDRVVRGEHIITESDKLAELYHLLRGLRFFFEELVCRWVPREGLSTVDSMTKMKDLSRNESEEQFITISLPKAWGPILSGAPIFSIRETSSKLRNAAKKRLKCPEDLLKMHKVFYHLVDDKEEDKLSAMWHICHALKPQQVNIIIGGSSVKMLSKIKDMFGTQKAFEFQEGEGSYELRFDLYEPEETVRNGESVRNSKCLNVLMDAKQYEEESFDEDSLTVVLANKEEQHTLKDVVEFGPITFVSFQS